ncbi:SdpI family protein [Kordiimonas laminariae]|uniref:SdpI family protein n=1 Tax=Kordiimonas laminariae TaxID=2917717 RepID=UPI001FF23D47|nr:SdpI family protein [Kordiimonas laminariae]MCK0068866.1 SdpI family protein [Kordiimonas laminariae]
MLKLLKWPWAIAIITLAVGLYSYFQLDPSIEIPVHWNINGEVDRTASPLGALLGVPGTFIIVLLILSFLKQLEPRREHLEQSGKAFQAITIGVSIVILIAQGMIISAAFGYATITINTLVGGIGLMFAVMGNYLGKLKSTFFVGIRTPWTLSSETVWKKTHRLAGKLYVVIGLIIIALSFLVSAKDLSYVLIAVLMPAAFFPLGYSWYIWKQEQNELIE